MKPSIALGEWSLDTYVWSVTASYLVDVLLVAVCSAVLGSKMFHVLFEAPGHVLSHGSEARGVWDLLRDDPWHWARLFDPGYVFYGGLLVATLATWAFVTKRGLPRPLAIGDCMAPALAFGIVLGRAGCFWAGCCYGTSAEGLPWGVTYPDQPLASLGLVHPTQLYDATFGLLALVAMAFLYRKRRFDGQIFLWFLMGYSVWRFTTEFFRGDAERGIWVSWASTSQLISLGVFALAALCALRLQRQVGRSSLDNWAQV
jgi:phosphatidylglycerol:prolipoprotein diacylglycerol transferase